MPQPRSSQISLSDTPYYQCISRCVRRSFLCGIDNYSGQSYEHRRGWVEERLLFLAKFTKQIYQATHNNLTSKFTKPPIII